MASPQSWGELLDRLIAETERGFTASSWVGPVVTSPGDTRRGNFRFDEDDVDLERGGTVTVPAETARRIDASAAGALRDHLAEHPEDAPKLLGLLRRDLMIVVHELIHALGPGDAKEMRAAYQSAFEWTFGKVVAEGTAQLITERFFERLLLAAELDGIHPGLVEAATDGIAYPAETAAMEEVWRGIAGLVGRDLDGVLIEAAGLGSRPTALFAMLGQVAERHGIAAAHVDSLVAAVAGPLDAVAQTSVQGTAAERAERGRRQGAIAATSLRDVVRRLRPREVSGVAV